MKRPDHIPLNDFIYDLPEERIAKFPLPERDQSRLLIYRQGLIDETRFINLPAQLASGQVLVFNDTRVIHARIRFRKQTGGSVELFCLEPLDPADHQLAFGSVGKVEWQCLVGNARKWKSDEVLQKEIGSEAHDLVLRAKKKDGQNGSFRIEFSWSPENLSFSEVLEISGETPIPPYLKREAVPEDSVTYQTVYSTIEGSVAAPTAGLHFTNKLLKEIDRQGIERLNLTLHVGAGTFKPVKSENALEHPMHEERFHVNSKVIRKLASSSGKIIATGTTSCRTLESLYWLGVKVLSGGINLQKLQLSQWEYWDLPDNVPVSAALEALAKWADTAPDAVLTASTKIMIVPGYRFRMINGLITNFHQPSSTLLMLIAAFIGDDWKKVYRYALENGFRFLSYGDSSLLLP